MACNSPSTPSLRSGYSTASSRPSSSLSTSYIDSGTYNTGIQRVDDISKLRSTGDVPPHELHVQSATRSLPDINPSDPTTLGVQLPTRNPFTIDSDRCIFIIQALATPFLDTRRFDNITPAEFNFITRLSYERKQDRVHAKLIYDDDLHELIAMAPYAIHEVSFQHISDCIRTLLDGLSLHRRDPDIVIKSHYNLSIENENTTLIPDFHLDVRPVRPPGAPAVPFWVGECGFSSTLTAMERKLRMLADIAPGMDTAIVISIREAKHPLPSRDHPLHSCPVLPRSDFMPTTTPKVNSLDPIVVQGITWLEVKSVTVRVFLRQADSTFNFKERGASYAQGSLFPELQMHDVETILNEAVKRLILRVVRMLEDADADVDKISRLRSKSETETFPTEWSLLLRDLQMSLCDTARSRYYLWLQEKPKQKGDGDPSLEPRKRPAPSAFPSCVSHHTATETTNKRMSGKRRRKSGKRR